MLPPGRARLATKPAAIGSVAATMTIGIDVVAFCAAPLAGSPNATMISTLRRTSSAARAGNRSSFPSADRTQASRSAPRRNPTREASVGTRLSADFQRLRSQVPYSPDFARLRLGGERRGEKQNGRHAGQRDERRSYRHPAPVGRSAGRRELNRALRISWRLTLAVRPTRIRPMDRPTCVAPSPGRAAAAYHDQGRLPRCRHLPLAGSILRSASEIWRRRDTRQGRAVYPGAHENERLPDRTEHRHLETGRLAGGPESAQGHCRRQLGCHKLGPGLRRARTGLVGLTDSVEAPDPSVGVHTHRPHGARIRRAAASRQARRDGSRRRPGWPAGGLAPGAPTRYTGRRRHVARRGDRT